VNGEENLIGRKRPRSILRNYFYIRLWGLTKTTKNPMRGDRARHKLRKSATSAGTNLLDIANFEELRCSNSHSVFSVQVPPYVTFSLSHGYDENHLHIRPCPIRTIPKICENLTLLHFTHPSSRISGQTDFGLISYQTLSHKLIFKAKSSNNID
jgi:hypothetical protein